MIQLMTIEHIKRYGEIYAAAFSGPPWNDRWKPANAEIHVREIMESKQSYGLMSALKTWTAGRFLLLTMNTGSGRDKTAQLLTCSRRAG